MKKLLRVFTISVVLFLGGLAFSSEPVSAKLKASSEYNIGVSINEKGRVWVDYTIRLINQSDNFFIRDYSIIVAHKDLTGLTVTEQGKPITFTKEFLDDKVRVKATLRNKLVDKGSSTTVTFRYETRQLFFKEGLLWKLYIPAVKTEEDLLNAYVKVTIPQVYGDVAQGYFKDKSIKKEGGNNIITFRQQDNSDGLLLLLGTEQQYEFTYTYLIENLEDTKKVYTITLPPDTKEQRVYYLNAQPQPEQTLIAQNDNVVVRYTLDAGETQEIKIAGFTRFSQPSHYEQRDIRSEIYLQAGEIWNYAEENVQNRLQQLVKSDYSTYEQAQVIYDFTIAYLTHSFESESTRIPISTIIEKKDNPYSCLQYADLFVGLARGAGIPARLIVGYTTSGDNIDALHHWGEFYDDQRKNWVAVDPCFEDSFGFNEFEQTDNNRIILGFWEDSGSALDFPLPYETYQPDQPESIKILASAQSYLENQQFAYIETSVGSPNFLNKDVPLHITIANQSQSIFSAVDLFIDDQVTEAFLVEDIFYPGVFPTQTSDISINLGEVESFDYDPSKNHTVTIVGKHNGGTVSESYDFGLRGALILLHVVLWGVAAACAFSTIIVISFMIKKIKQYDRRFNFRAIPSRVRSLRLLKRRGE